MAIKSLAEQIANKCVHFNGMGGKNAKCRVGIHYDNVTVNGKGFAGIPCFKEGEAMPCDQRHYPTTEEVENIVAEEEADIERTNKAWDAVAVDAKSRGFKKSNGGRGEVKCPCCEPGIIHYSVASYNGHVHAACTSPDCVRWMQ